MSRPMLIRRSVAGVTAVIVLVVGFLMVSSYEQAALYKQKESDSPLTARWLDIAFVGATDPNAPARRNSRVFLSSRLLAEAASTIESAAPTATVATSAPSAPPTAFPSSKHPSVSPSTSAPSPQPTFSVSHFHYALYSCELLDFRIVTSDRAHHSQLRRLQRCQLQRNHLTRQLLRSVYDDILIAC